MEFIFLFLILLLVVILSFVWPPDSPWSPWWRTDKKTARAIIKFAGVTKKDLVYELGSGDGEFLIVTAREFGINSVGIEIDPIRFFISKVRVKLNGVSDNIKLIKKDFKKVNITDADVVFVYLVPKALERIFPKLKKELKKGTRVVSYRYKIPGVKVTKEDKKKPLYLYIF